MFDGGFVAKGSSLKPRPSLMYLEAQMIGRIVSGVDMEAMHFFMSSKFARDLGLVDT